MRIHVSRLHFPVTTLGLGRRVGIWFQGCTLHCPGCVSVDTWAVGRGETSVGAVLDTVRSWLPESDGVTISGGEPFQQIEALEELLRGLRAMAPSECDILIYSGYAWGDISARTLGWPQLADALISEPFQTGAGQTLAWRGSDNQQMHLLTPLGHLRYFAWVSALRSTVPPALDVAFLDGEVWMAGIPLPGTLESIGAELAADGFSSATSQAGARPSPPIFA